MKKHLDSFHGRRCVLHNALVPELIAALEEAICWILSLSPEAKSPAQRGANCETAYDLEKMLTRVPKQAKAIDRAVA